MSAPGRVRPLLTGLVLHDYAKRDLFLTWQPKASVIEWARWLAEFPFSILCVR
jgi:hypothetical protein